MRQVILSLFLFLHFATSVKGDSPFIKFDWSELPDVPSHNGYAVPLGLAGAFTGIHNDVLIIAGGANFPNGMVWEGGTKVYHKYISILEKKADDDYQWFEEKQFSLPYEVAYGLTIPTDNGLVCIGGMNSSEFLSSVFLLKWDDANKEIKIEDLPPLPIPLANMSGGKIGDKIYVAASEEETGSKYFYSLDLSNLEAEWSALPVWDGSPRTHAFGVVQNNGEIDCFYLFNGRFKGGDVTSKVLSDAYVYNPKANYWTKLKTNNEFPLAAGTCVAVGANHVLLFGGDEGNTFNRLEKLGADINAATDTTLIQELINERDSILKNHTGFSKDIWAFHTITQSWTKIGTLPYPTQVTTTALRWDNQILIPSGEIAPSVRTPKISAVSLSNNTSFGLLNYIVLLVYLGMLIGIGFIFSKNQHSTNDFFKGGNRIPWWAAGISIFGTQLSAITFMAIPAKTFATDWLYFFLMMTIIMVSPFIIRYFLPFYRRFNLTTAYEYLELRFNLLTRLVGSSMYIFLQLGRLGIVLLLPSLALSVATGIDVYICILSMGILSIFYTVLGGIEAVIWTDVVQVIVLLGGALLSLALLYFNLDSNDISTYVSEFQKMRIFDFELSFSNPTLWVVLIGGFATNIVQYGSDQTVIQRYLTTKDERGAAKGIMTGAWLTLPATLIFFALGTLLFVHYKTSPELLNPVLEKTDAIFPWYIVNSLPQGISGLLIAAVFAASMSSLDSSMNSVATVVTTDFFRRLWPLNSESAYLKLARSITIVIGLIGTALALVMATWGISSLWDQFNMIVGLFAGGLGGIFVLGVFSKKTNGAGALTGLVVSGILQYLIKDYSSIHLLMYAFTGMFASIIIGYLSSQFFGSFEKEKMQFTYFGLKNKRPDE
jgi:cyclically-permuted mutarotase family protein